MIKGIRYFVTVSLLRCVACSMHRDALLRSPGHAGLLGNYLSENQITYCLDVSSLRLCQITHRQLGISNNTCLMKEPAFSMSCVLRGWANWFREVNLAPPWSSLHWGNCMTFISSDGLVLIQLLNLPPRTNNWTFVFLAIPLLGKFWRAIDIMTSEN